jgi:hypothetical protein
VAFSFTQFFLSPLEKNDLESFAFLFLSLLPRSVITAYEIIDFYILDREFQNKSNAFEN